MVFGMLTRVGLRNHVLGGAPDPHTWKGNFQGEKGLAQDMPDMSDDRYTQSNSSGVSTSMVRMPIGVY